MPSRPKAVSSDGVRTKAQATDLAEEEEAQLEYQNSGEPSIVGGTRAMGALMLLPVCFIPDGAIIVLTQSFASP